MAATSGTYQVHPEPKHQLLHRRAHRRGFLHRVGLVRRVPRRMPHPDDPRRARPIDALEVLLGEHIHLLRAGSVSTEAVLNLQKQHPAWPSIPPSSSRPRHMCSTRGRGRGQCQNCRRAAPARLLPGMEAPAVRAISSAVLPSFLPAGRRATPSASLHRSLSAFVENGVYLHHFMIASHHGSYYL
eukprot:scaffold1396_cov252-Pinguiococcus_pyrenoidosus.AAC.14